MPRAFREAPALDPRRRVGPSVPGELLLINPFYAKDPHASFGKHVLTPTLALTSIAGATPEGWRARYWDENLLQGPPPCEPFPEVVGITVHLTFARRAYALADWYRERGARVVLGGLHVLSCPDEAQAHADVIVVGEGMSVWPRVLADLRAGCARPRYDGSYLTPYREQPAPDRTVLPRQSFLTTTSLIATRGCHNRCEFCYLATDGLTMPYHMLAPEEVARQIEADGQPYSVFIDNNLGSRRDYLRRLCQALRPLGRIWSAAVTIDVTDDPALVREMALAGCTGVFIGFESLTGENLIQARKRTPLPEDYARRIGILHDCGIQVNGSFVLGFDHDRSDCFEQLLGWIEACRMENATFHILTPYPGTPLFRRMEAEGRILHRDWDRYDTAHCVFQPRHMTPEVLEAGYAWCYERLLSLPSIWRRRPRQADAVLPYLAMMLLYKRSNALWEFLIRRRLVAAAWRPLVEVTRRRHLRFRRRLEPMPGSAGVPPASEPAEMRAGRPRSQEPAILPVEALLAPGKEAVR
jgi:radical SAM superfamily enzyme YgiQ (UPF0313 family)